MYELNGDICPNEATIICMGLPRSGTSMVAGVLFKLGLFMGGRADKAVFEDSQLGNAVETGDRGATAMLIAERNAEHLKWGFKRPNAYQHTEMLEVLCRNPRFIITFRDLLAISIRNNIAVQTDVLTGLSRAASQYSTLVQKVQKITHPALLVSYEKCLQFPEQFIDRIATFCSLSPTEQQRREALGMIENGRKDYVESARFVYVGRIDKFDGKYIKGWVKEKNSTVVRPMVVCQINGRPIAATRANKFRQDLKDSGHGDGKHAFEFTIAADTPEDAVISVVIENTKIEIADSGKKLSEYRIARKMEKSA
jgi:hypothetical protein